MITSDDILNMNFYKKEKFTGSYQGMRYLIKKDSQPQGDSTDAEPKLIDIFRATLWPGPYNYETTPEEKKTTAAFPFTPEGKQQMVDWMNAQWESRKNEWCQR